MVLLGCEGFLPCTQYWGLFGGALAVGCDFLRGEGEVDVGIPVESGVSS